MSKFAAESLQRGRLQPSMLQPICLALSLLACDPASAEGVKANTLVGKSIDFDHSRSRRGNHTNRNWVSDDNKRIFKRIDESLSRTTAALEKISAETAESGPFNSENWLYSAITIAALLGGLIFAGLSARAGLAASKAAAMDLRPWLQISDVAVNRIILNHAKEGTAINGAFFMRFSVKNIGKTPARLVSIKPYAVLLKRKPGSVTTNSRETLKKALDIAINKFELSVIWPDQTVPFESINDPVPHLNYDAKVDIDLGLSSDMTAGDIFVPYVYIVCSYLIDTQKRAFSTRVFNLNPKIESAEEARIFNRDKPFIVKGVATSTNLLVSKFERIDEDIVT